MVQRVFLILVAITLAKLSDSQFIKLNKKTHLFEFKVNENLNDDDTIYQSFQFEIDSTCSEVIDTPQPRSVKRSNTKDYEFNTSISIYKGNNYNLRFMLEINFRSLAERKTFNGFEIKIADINYRKPYCIRIIPVEDNLIVQNFKFTLKDPPILRSSNDYTFYFGKVKVNDLIRCELNGKHWCVNESDALSAIDTGIANLNKEYDLRNFEMENSCTLSVLNDTCLRTYRVSKEKSFLIIMHPFPQFISVISNQISQTKPIPIIHSYQTETLNGMIFKIAEIGNEVYRFLNYFKKSNEQNVCEAESAHAGRNLCHCNDKCVPCYDPNIQEPEFIKQTIRINNTDVTTPYNNLRCESNYYTTTNFRSLPLRFQFQGNLIDEKYGYRFNNFLPKICTSIKLNKNVFFLDGTPSFELQLKFNDYNFIAQTNLVNVSYQINLHYVCVNRTGADYAYGSVLQDKIIRPHEKAVFDKLRIGQYAIEIIPKLQSDECGSLCPYLHASGNGNDSFSELKCEECKKIVHFYTISASFLHMSDDEISKVNCLNEIIDFEAINFNENLSDDALYFDQTLKNFNQSLLFNLKFPIIYPQELLESRSCESFAIDIVIYGTGPYSYLFLSIFIIIFFFVGIVALKFFVNTNFKKQFNDTKMLIVLSIKSQNPEAMSNAADRFFKVLTTQFNKLSYEIIDLRNMNDSEVMKHYFNKNLIIYICDNQQELDYTKDLMLGKSECMIIGKNRPSHYYNYLFYQRQLKEKTILVSFDSNVKQNNFKDERYFYMLPEDYTEFVFKVLEKTTAKNGKELFSCCGLEKTFIYFDLICDTVKPNSCDASDRASSRLQQRQSELSDCSTSEIVNHISIQCENESHF